MSGRHAPIGNVLRPARATADGARRGVQTHGERSARVPAVAERPPVVLAIHRICLDGLAMDRACARSLRMSIERELAARIRSSASIPRSASLERVDAPAIDTALFADPVRLGREIARRVQFALPGHAADGSVA